MVTELDGSWAAADWSPDDEELALAQLADRAETHLWRVDVEDGRRRGSLPKGKSPPGARPQVPPDGRIVYALSNRGSELPRVWRCDVAAGTWTP